MTEFERLVYTPSDINEHLEVLRDLSKECSHITEMGVRSVVSTFAFAEGIKPHGRLVSLDIVQPPEERLQMIRDICADKDALFEFKIANTTQTEIEPTDLLFIDTLHTEEQLRKELALHASKAKRYIVFHDTVSCALELWPAIADFMSGPEVMKVKNYKNNNGLLVLERV